MINLPSLIESAAKGNEDQRNLYYGFLSLLNGLGAQTKQLAPPAEASVSVTAANGIYSIQITNPSNPQNTPIYHEVSYSTVKNFSQNVITLSPSTATGVVIPAPGQTMFFRLRSSYDRSTWNNYQLAQTSAVQSGLQSSAAMANNAPLNQSNFAMVDSIANGASAAIRVYGTAGPYHSYVDVKGGVQSVVPSATIINASYNSTAIVAYDGVKFRTSPILPGIFDDTWKPVGVVSVVGAGAPTLPAISPIISGGQIIGYNVTSGGAGATGNYTLTLGSTGGGTGATFGAQNIQNGVLISVAPGNPGSGYSGGTTVTVSGGVFTGQTGGGGAVGGNGGRLTQFTLGL